MPCERQFFSRQGFLNTADCDGSNLEDYREHALGIIFHPVSHPGDAEIFARRISKKTLDGRFTPCFYCEHAGARALIHPHISENTRAESCSAFNLCQPTALGVITLSASKAVDFWFHSRRWM
jgi:hypothetical protein